MKGFGNIMKEAQKLQAQMEQLQAEAGNKKVEATAGGGMITAVVSGRLDLVSLKIDPSVVDPKDVAMLQDLVVAAVNQALQKAKAMAQGELAKATGGLSIPGMPPIL